MLRCRLKVLFVLFTFHFALFTHEASASVRHEAELARQTRCEVVNDSRYSGKKALRLTEQDVRIVFSVDVEAKDKYTIYVAGDGVGGEKVVNCAVNGSKSQFRMNAYKEVEVGDFIMKAGANEVVITPNWTWFDVDYIRLENSAGDIEFNVSAVPVDNDATMAAREMYGFLYDNFGRKTISGIMVGDMTTYNGNVLQHADVQAVYKASGQYPALVGFDFMNSTGKNESESWNRDYSRASVELAKDICRRGGIPAFTWHWRDPSRKTDAFYSSEASVKISSAMNPDGSWNRSSALYKYIIQDIHSVADLFLELQDENMACIFRPLHEASGKWFWWGNDGAEHFRQLYRLIYDEMVHVKGVHNVIWVWNADPDDKDWNPGADYYDVVSADIYNEAFDYSSSYSVFDKLKMLTEGRRIVALSENGPIPDIQQQIEDGAMWSWWMPWYQTWNGRFVDKTSADEWKKCMTDPHVITLGDMKGWNTLTHIEKVTSNKENAQVYDLSGRAVSSPSAKKLYIIGNKKVIFQYKQTSFVFCKFAEVS